MTVERSPLPPALPLTVGVIAISFASIFIEWSNSPASVIGMYRLAFTVVLFVPFVFRYKRAILQIAWRDWMLLALSGAFLGLHFLFWIESLKRTTVASSMILMSLQPAFAMAGAYFVLAQRPDRRGLWSLLLALVGTAIVSGGDLGKSNAVVIGDMLSLLGAAAIAASRLIGQVLSARTPAYVYNVSVFFFAALVLCAYNLGFSIPMAGYPWRDWGIFALLALVPTVFGHALFNWLLKWVNAVTISMAILGEPIGAIALAYLLLGQTVRGYQVVGGAVTLFGVFLFLKNRQLLVRR
ncbi:DMT family transporter [Alicyclobacillus tolerans]|uniref:DMT family transporter n=1 Tax=Alicyclobacillus tolerans TaxID=90970 RepID=UPI001F1EB8A9|nr:DMT family transporter [Alicyclobacillus tolerans]MCF8566946.1 DMT family transporter [Alicyclobacillus tolerans]